jgi:hypothetical protein
MATRPTQHPPSVRRQALAIVAGLAAMALGALIFGEYDLSGLTPFIGGALFGLIVAEVVLTVAGTGNRVLAAFSAACSGVGVYWAAWISSGRGIAPIPKRAYVGLVLSMILAAGWVLISSGRRKPKI